MITLNETNMDPIPVPPPIPSVNGQDVPPVPQAPQNIPLAPQQPGSPAPKKRFPKKLIIILFLIVFLIVAALIVIKVVLPKLNNTSQTGTVTWWGLWEDSATVAPLISEYESAHPGVKINYVREDKEDYRERLTNALARGTGPDIFTIHNSWVPMFREELSILPSSVMTAQEYTQSFYPIAVSDLASGSSFVGMPLQYDGLALFINSDIFTNYGKTPPKTWIELRQDALELTIKDENGVIQQAGVSLGRTENVDNWQEILALMMLQNGVDLSSPVGDRAEGALKFFTVFSTTDRVWDETLPPSTIDFANGKLAMYIGPSWRVFDIKAQNPNLNFRVVPVPQLPKDRPDEPDITYATYWAQSVSQRSKVKDLSWDFLKFMASKDSLEKVYLNATKTRVFGELYPRPEMASNLLSNNLTGGFLQYAPTAKSWYLGSRTFDGTTGINTLLSQYFEDAINKINTTNPSTLTSITATLQAGVQQVLSQYGLAPARE